jgi:putative ABC transport system substrate-binding protein
MRRREFITLLGGAAAAWPLGTHAQQGERMRRVGVLVPTAESDAEGQSRASAIQQGLEQRGWIVGGNVQIDYRWAAGDMDRLRNLAAELVASKPDVIVASATNPTAALHRATTTIPIVFVQVIDPVGGGYVESLAHPGGNITGFSMFEYGIAGKWLELLKQIAPRVVRVAVIHEPTSPQAAALLREIDSGAGSFGVQTSAMGVRDQTEIERGIEAFAQEPNGGLIVLTSPLTVAHRDLLIALAAQYRLPSVYPFRYFATSGGLASYGVDNNALYLGAMSYVDRILKGEKPGDLPVQQATKFELVINLKTAKVLGLTIPPGVLAIADEVID